MLPTADFAGLCQATSNQPLAPKIPANPRSPVAELVESSPLACFLSGSHLCVSMAYTPPWAIKEKKEDEERVGNFH